MGIHQWITCFDTQVLLRYCQQTLTEEDIIAMANLDIIARFSYSQLDLCAPY